MSAGRTCSSESRKFLQIILAWFTPFVSSALRKRSTVSRSLSLNNSSVCGDDVGAEEQQATSEQERPAPTRLLFALATALALLRIIDLEEFSSSIEH